MNFDVRKHLNEQKEQLIDLNDKIWEYAETRFEEYKSTKALKSYLADNGFAIEDNTADIETAFVASYGKGRPVIAILAEYDALSGLSQKGGITEREALVDDGNGHGCGHNIFGSASAGAAVVVKKWLESTGREGTIQLIGCPGEEGGSGKTFMAKKGVFNDLDSALAWHPASVNAVMSVSTLANYQVYFRFKGIASHAATSPHLGRSALDAVELMNVGVNYLREHIIPEARVHYAVTNTGGNSPNVVQSNATVLYLIRAPKMHQVEDIYRRICKIAQGAAMMTETEVEIVFDKGCSNYLPNRELEKVLYNNMVKAGAPEFDQNDMNFAQAIRETFSKSGCDGEELLTNFIDSKEFLKLAKEIQKKPLCCAVLPYVALNITMPASTDVGDVSCNVPTVQFVMSCYANGTPAHSWQMVSQGVTSLAHKGMLKAAEVLARTGIDLIQHPEAVKRAREEFEEVNASGYVCPIPDGVKPSPVK